MKYLLGLDAGTSNTKAVLFDLNGREKFKLTTENKVIEINNKAEQDMNYLWENTADLIKNLIRSNDIDPNDILAVGVTGQGEGAWLVDKNDTPVSNAILWCDGRSSKTVERLKTEKNISEEINKITGSYPFSGATSIVLKWLKKNQPEKLKKAKYCLFCKDWIRYKLTGNYFMEYSDASTSLLNIKNENYSEQLLDLLDIKEVKKLFPPLIKSHSQAGTITKEASQKTGLKEGTPIAAGMLDIVATATGTGTTNSGDICTILGTTCSNVLAKSNYSIGERNRSGYECHSIDGLYVNIIASMAGTPNLDWGLNNLFSNELEKYIDKSRLFDFLESKLKEIPVGSKGIIYHPYISESGERAPFYDPNAKAQFFGVSSSANRYHLLRSIYEGIAYSIRDCLPMDSQGKLFLGGGGSKSDFWAQIISDCTNREVVISNTTEFAAKGAALAAGKAVGLYEDLAKTAKEKLIVRQEFKPREKNVKVYEEYFDIYQNIRKTMQSFWKKRKKIIDAERG